MNRLRKRYVIIALLAGSAVCTALLFAFGGTKPDSKDGKTSGEIVLTGRVRLVGSMPFPELMISEESGVDWYIRADESAKLKDFEQQNVTVSAHYDIHDVVLADGKKIGVRRVLSNISIVEDNGDNGDNGIE
jgi:hypothetical protein